MLRKTLVGAEITSEGIYTVFNQGEKKDYKVFENLPVFFESLPRFSKVNVSIAMDEVFVRKLLLPLEAREYIEENTSLLAEDFFPIKDIETKFYIVSEENSLEVLVFGIKNAIIEPLKTYKKINLITLSPFLYVLDKKKSSFLRVLRQLSSNFYEFSVFREGKLNDTFLLTEEEANQKEYDIFIEDRFFVAEKLLKVDSSLDFFLFKREKKSKKIYYLSAFNIILAIFTLYEYVDLRKTINELKNVEKEITKLTPIVDKYHSIINETHNLRKQISIINNFKSESIKYLWYISQYLPKNSKLIEYTYEHNNKWVIIEGYTPSTIKLARQLENTNLFKSVLIENIPEKANGLEKFRIKLVF